MHFSISTQVNQNFPNGMKHPLMDITTEKNALKRKTTDGHHWKHLKTTRVSERRNTGNITHRIHVCCKYMVTWSPSIYPKCIQMLAYIPAPWILWVIIGESTVDRWFQQSWWSRQPVVDSCSRLSRISGVLGVLQPLTQPQQVRIWAHRQWNCPPGTIKDHLSQTHVHCVSVNTLFLMVISRFWLVKNFGFTTGWGPPR